MDDVEQRVGGDTEEVGAKEGFDPAPGQDADAPTGDGGGTEAAEPDTWVTDDVRELAESYGLGDADLAEFESEAEFRRSAAWLDRELAKSVKPPAADEAPEPSKNEKPPVKEAAEDQLDLDLQKYVDGEYDDGVLNIVKFAKQLREEARALKAELAEIKPAVEHITQSQREEMRLQYVNAFHDMADGDDESLFGRSVVNDKVAEIAAPHQENRRLVWEAMDTLATGLLARGQEIPPMKVLYQRAKQLALAEKLRSRESARRRDAIAAQSKKRRSGAGGARAQSAAGGGRDPANDPKVVAAFARMREQVPGE